MNRIFADAFYYIARLNPADPAHRRARAFRIGRRVHVVTTEWVLTEVADALAGLRHRPTVTDFLHKLILDPATTIIPASRELYREGLNFYARRRDKEWSLTDCTSFIIMEDERIREALTADHHFEQAGYTA
jgi:predicted nucleic acid-binding protein